MKEFLARLEALEQSVSDLIGDYEGLTRRLDDLTKPDCHVKKGKAESLEEVLLHCAKSGISPQDGEWFWNKMEGTGWKINGHLLKDWRRCLNAWKLAHYLPSQRLKENGKPLPLKSPTLRELAPREWERTFGNP